MVFETFKRRKQLAEKQGAADVYVYDNIPYHLKHQILTAVLEGLGPYGGPSQFAFHSSPNANKHWELVDRVCRKEIEVYLKYLRVSNLNSRFNQAFGGAEDVDDALSLLEVVCVLLSKVKDRHAQETEQRGAVMTAQNALDEINERFKQHGVGYQFENASIIRVNSEFTHSSIIKPALTLVQNKIFRKVNEDFITSHRHYRSGEHKDAVTSANRAFESMLKAICDAKGWIYKPGDRATELVSIVRREGLFRLNFDKSFDTYIAMMKSGLPAVRNDAGGHGEGLGSAAVTAEVAQFAINMTATNIVFLGECYHQL